MGSYTELMMDKIYESHTWLLLENDIEIKTIRLGAPLHS